MNFYEAEIKKMQRHIKELEENPGQRLKSFKIFLEKKIESRKEQIEALRQGKPLIDADPLAPCFFRAMGFLPYDRGPSSTQKDGGLSGAMSPAAYKEKARSVLGLPVDTACDQTYLLAGNVAAGTMPMEPLVSCTDYQCPMLAQQKFVMVHKWPNDIFYFHVPFQESEAALEYVVDQLRQFIEVAERKFPGVIKYDEAKLIELQTREKAAARYLFEIYQMLGHKPCPVDGEDACEAGQWYFRDLEYLRARRDEIAERIAKGFAAVPGEKLRVLWVHTRIRFFEPFQILAKRQMPVIFRYSDDAVDGYLAPIPRPAYYGGRKLTPLEEEAAHMLQHIKGGTGAHHLDNLMRICRDLKIDALVSVQHLGAICYLGLKRLISERAEKELGIPTLDLEMKRWDTGYVDEATITARLDEFAQMCLSRKGMA